MGQLERLESDISELKVSNKLILDSLKHMGVLNIRNEFLTRKEFMERAKIGHSKLHQLMSEGLIQFNRAGHGRKLIRIPFSELIRFQRGEIK